MARTWVSSTTFYGTIWIGHLNPVNALLLSLHSMSDGVAHIVEVPRPEGVSLSCHGGDANIVWVKLEIGKWKAARDSRWSMFSVVISEIRDITVCCLCPMTGLDKGLDTDYVEVHKWFLSPPNSGPYYWTHPVITCRPLLFQLASVLWSSPLPCKPCLAAKSTDTSATQTSLMSLELVNTVSQVLRQALLFSLEFFLRQIVVLSGV